MTPLNPRTRWVRAALAALSLACIAGVPAAPAAGAKPAEPTLEQRVADLEAYVNNKARTPGVESRVPGPGPGHNAWMMTSAALVLFMTLPGLALFYGGLVRRKNVLSVLAQCLGIAGLVAILWWAVGYSLVFGPGGPYLGGLKYAFLRGVDSAPNTDYGQWVSQNVFAMYQLMFAIITPSLIVGAVAERIKFTSVMVFVAAWMFLVYFPLAHMVWGADGLMNGTGNPLARISAIDFAGGTVVHMSSGWSALVLCLIVGRRIGFGRENMSPHSLVLCMVGTGMLWVGWYGFNAGSALGADGIAANAFMTTTLATAVASFTWGRPGARLPGPGVGPRVLLRRGRRPCRHHPRHGLRRRHRLGRHRPLRGLGPVRVLRTGSRRCSATTTRWTRSASTRSAARSGRS